MGAKDRLRRRRPREASTPSIEARRVVYASGNFSKNLLWGAADVTLLFLLTERLGVAPAAAGALLLLSLIADAGGDLLVGHVADRLRSPLGRYGPFILLGAPACALSFIWLYALPRLGVRDPWVIAAGVIGFRALFAAIDVPHNALLAKVCADSSARGRVSGYRFFFSSLASLVIAVTMAPAVANPARAAGGQMLALAAAFAVTSVVTLYLAWWAVRAHDHGEPRPAPSAGGGASLARDGLFLNLVLIAFLTGATAPIFVKTSFYYVAYVLPYAASTAWVLSAVVAGQFAGVVVWSGLAGRFEKRTILAAAHLVCALGFAVTGLLGARGPTALVGGAALVGLGLAGVYALPWALAADAVDYGALRSGKRRDAFSFALLIVAMKIGIGVGAAAVGWSLSIAGYVPGAAQTPQARDGIVLIMTAAPFVGAMLCAAAALGSPITHRGHAIILRRLARRRPRG